MGGGTREFGGDIQDEVITEVLRRPVATRERGEERGNGRGSFDRYVMQHGKGGVTPPT